MKRPTVKIGIMRSQWEIGGKYYKALVIDGKRHGPDAGPWTIIDEFRVDAQELKEAAEQALQN